MPSVPLHILVARHSAFYSPLIATIAGGFLDSEGLDATYGVLPPNQRARDLIRRGDVDVAQSAVSSSWGPMEQGERDLPVHFAQINRRDGFFLAARQADPSFQWKKLEGATLLADHGGQPLVMLRYAAFRNGIDWGRIKVVDAGNPGEILAAFLAGHGDYIHLQGPAPQQLECDGGGFVVVAVGAAMPPVAFSSLTASREFLQTDPAQGFMRVYRKARRWVVEAKPEEIAQAESRFFPGTSPDALIRAIAAYQALGCWDGDPSIPRDLYEQALDVFLHSGAITRRHAYEDVVCSFPGCTG